MNNSLETQIIKKMIQKEILNELCSKNLIDFTNTSNIIRKLDEDVSKLKELQKKNGDLKNIMIKILV